DHGVFLLLALRPGHHHDHFVPARRADQREPDAGIARRAFNDHTARTQLTFSFRVLHDRQRRAILHALARVEKLSLAQNGAAGFFARALEFDQRRVADGVDNVGEVFHSHRSYLRQFLTAAKATTGAIAAKVTSQPQSLMNAGKRAL